MDTIAISRQTAEAIIYVLNDILAIDQRAKCSDKYFRAHFKTLATLPAAADAKAELEHALATPKANRPGAGDISHAGATDGAPAADGDRVINRKEDTQ